MRQGRSKQEGNGELQNDTRQFAAAPVITRFGFRKILPTRFGEAGVALRRCGLSGLVQGFGDTLHPEFIIVTDDD